MKEHVMTPQSKAKRSEAAKKGAATRQRKKVSEAGNDARDAAKQAASAGGEAAKARGRALKSAAKSKSSRSKG
jgi:hypothetical protein